MRNSAQLWAATLLQCEIMRGRWLTVPILFVLLAQQLWLSSALLCKVLAAAAIQQHLLESSRCIRIAPVH